MPIKRDEDDDGSRRRKDWSCVELLVGAAAFLDTRPYAWMRAMTMMEDAVARTFGGSLKPSDKVSEHDQVFPSLTDLPLCEMTLRVLYCER